MKKLAIYIASAFMISQAYAQQNEIRLSIEEAVQYAENKQPDFQNYLIDEKINERRMQETRTAYYPKLSGTADLRNNFQRPTIVLPAEAFRASGATPGKGEEFIAIRQGTPWAATAALELNQPILDLTAAADVAIAQKSRELSQLTTRQARINQQIAVRSTYYAALLNQELLQQTTADVLRNKTFYEDVKNRFDNGRALRIELNRAYLNFSNAELQQQKALDAFLNSKALLAKQIGLEDGAVLVLTDKLDAFLPADTSFVNMQEDELMQKRVEVRSESVSRELNLLSVQKMNRQYLPTLSAYGYLGTQAFRNEFNFFSDATWFPVGYVGLRLSMPLFDGLQKRAIAQQQRLQIHKNENKLRSLERHIAYEQQSASSNLKNASRNLSMQQKNMDIAKEVMQDAQHRYQEGAGTNQDVVEAEFTLQQTQTSYFQALYELMIAKLEWERVNARL
jgi:outer membrane protein